MSDLANCILEREKLFDETVKLKLDLAAAQKEIERLRELLQECEQELEYYSGQTRARDLLQKLKRLRGE